MSAYSLDLRQRILTAVERGMPRSQMPVAGVGCVSTFLSLGVLAVQVGMVLNSIWGTPFREVSTIISAFS